MSFLDIIQKTDFSQIKDSINSVKQQDVANTLKKTSFGIMDFPALISPAASHCLEKMAACSRATTMLRFGKTVKLYAPLYISNECVNECAYCGFNTKNKIKRKTLTQQEVIMEADSLYDQGFRHVLIVSGENKRKVPVDFLEDVSRELTKKFPAVAIEVYPMDTEDYKKLVRAGVSSIALYQETYHRKIYATVHKGPKADFNNRLLSIEAAGQAGFREIGIGTLIGLADFRVDMTCLALHAEYLMKSLWKSGIAISFPRLRAFEGSFKPAITVTDRLLAQAVFALRMVFPDADLVLSTREHPEFRNGMAGLGITRMSAGSKTNPGGYTLEETSLEQFKIADTRTPETIASMLQGKNLDPVWKDFDRSFLFD